MITNQEFNNNLETFVELILENLQLTDSTTAQLSVITYYIKYLPFEKCYSFISITVSSAIRLDFTISYHDYYQVPILNCRIYENERFITIPKSQSTLIIPNSTPVELQSHHLLQQPWLQTHPCETLQAIDEHLENAPDTSKYNRVIQYLCCWFGLYGLPSIFPQFSFRPNVY